jgi:hypothetical protein
MHPLQKYVIAAAVLLPATVGLAEQEEPCAVESSVPDVQLSLTLKGGQAVFREGEMIPLVLNFSTAVSRYWLNTSSYDRSGRLGIDVYCVEPDGTDPLSTYYKQGAFMGGGLFSEIQLASKPFTEETELNEWHHLPPGKYRLFVVSRRITRPPETGETAEAGKIGVPVRSNSVEFLVQPAEEEWQKEQVRAAVATLSGSPKPEDARHSSRVLRFLGTRDSTRAMARLFDSNVQQPGQYDLMLGLFSSSFPDVAVSAMRAEFASPTHAIGGEFLHTLVELQVLNDPAWSQPESESNSAEFWKRSRAHYADLMRSEASDLAALVGRKAGAARAITLNALLQSSDDDPVLQKTIRPALIAAWKDLPRHTQQEMIVYRWQALDTPEMMPVLRSIAAEAPPPFRSEWSDLRNAALRHIFEFEPTEGRELIARDLANPQASPSLENIRLLPPEQIQGALPAVADRLRNGIARQLDYELLDLYGDASALGSAQTAFEAQSALYDCDPRTHLLRFILRVSPETGVELVRASIADRTRTSCGKYLLQNLGDQLLPAQQIAIEALNDPEPEVVNSAVVALGNWGSAEAETPLWERLQRFHQEWASRANEVRISPEFDTPGRSAFNLEQSLTQAILGGHGWICPPDKLAGLSELVLSDYDLREVKRATEEWQNRPFQISAAWSPEENPRFQVLHSADLDEEQLKAKLAQFPSGTRFEWLIWLPGHIYPPVAVSTQEAVYERVRNDAEAHRVIVAKKTSEP